MNVTILKVEPSSYGAEPVTSARECPGPMAWHYPPRPAVAHAHKSRKSNAPLALALSIALRIAYTITHSILSAFHSAYRWELHGITGALVVFASSRYGVAEFHCRVCQAFLSGSQDLATVIVGGSNHMGILV